MQTITKSVITTVTMLIMDLKGQILPATMTVFLRKQLLKSQSLIVLLTAAMTKTMIAAAAMSMKDGE